MRLNSLAKHMHNVFHTLMQHASDSYFVLQEISVAETKNAWLQDLLQGSSQPRSAAATAMSASGSGVAPSSDPPSASGQLPQQVYESTVNLSFGGRTHQIRAQLAAIGAPVIGDVMYGAIAGAVVADTGIADEDLIERIDSCLQIDGPIGLHAYSMTWEGRTYTAAPPWAD